MKTGDGNLSNISRETRLSKAIVKQHLSFLQIKDYVTVSDFTVEDRNLLKPRGSSGTPYLLTPKGKSLMSRLTPMIDDLTADKILPELDISAPRYTILTE